VISRAIKDIGTVAEETEALGLLTRQIKRLKNKVKGQTQQGYYIRIHSESHRMS